MLDPHVRFSIQELDWGELTGGANPDIGRGSKEEGEERLGPAWAGNFRHFSDAFCSLNPNLGWKLSFS